jgi:haloalkane dehalogenase
MSVAQSSLALSPSALQVARPSWLSRTAFPFESRFLTVGGTRFHYVDEGKGSTLLFLHGGPMSSFMWRHQLRSLRTRYRCVAVDIPGLGLSRTPLVRGQGFARMADALQAFVDAVELEDFYLVVHATGGPSGLEMAVRERARLRGLVISNTFAWPLRDDPGLGTMVRLVSSRLFRFLVVSLNLLPRIAARQGRKYSKFDAEEKGAILGPYHDIAARAHLANLLYGLRVEAPFFARLEERLPTLASLPSLLIFGAADNGYRGGTMARFQKILRSDSTVVLPHSAHFLTEDEPQAYTAALERWLAAQGGPRASPLLARESPQEM